MFKMIILILQLFGGTCFGKTIVMHDFDGFSVDNREIVGIFTFEKPKSDISINWKSEDIDSIEALKSKLTSRFSWLARELKINLMELDSFESLSELVKFGRRKKFVLQFNKYLQQLEIVPPGESFKMIGKIVDHLHHFDEEAFSKRKEQLVAMQEDEAEVVLNLPISEVNLSGPWKIEYHWGHDLRSEGSYFLSSDNALYEQNRKKDGNWDYDEAEKILTIEYSSGPVATLDSFKTPPGEDWIIEGEIVSKQNSTGKILLKSLFQEEIYEKFWNRSKVYKMHITKNNSNFAIHSFKFETVDTFSTSWQQEKVQTKWKMEGNDLLLIFPDNTYRLTKKLYEGNVVYLMKTPTLEIRIEGLFEYE